MSRRALILATTLALLVVAGVVRAAEPDHVAVVFTDGRRAYGKITGFEDGKFNFDVYKDGKWYPYTYDQDEVREIMFGEELPTTAFRPMAELPAAIKEVGVPKLRALFAKQLASYSSDDDLKLLINIIAAWARETKDERQPLTVLRPLKTSARTMADKLHADLLIYTAYLYSGQMPLAQAYKESNLSVARLGSKAALLDYIEDRGTGPAAVASLDRNINGLLSLEAPRVPGEKTELDQKKSDEPELVKPKLDERGERYVTVAMKQIRDGLKSLDAEALDDALMLTMGISFRIEWGTERMVYELTQLKRANASNDKIAGVLDVLIYAAYLRGGRDQQEHGSKYLASHELDPKNEAAVKLRATAYATRTNDLVHKANVIFLNNGCPLLPTAEPARHMIVRKTPKKPEAPRTGSSRSKGKLDDGEGRRSHVIRIDNWGK